MKDAKERVGVGGLKGKGWGTERIKFNRTTTTFLYLLSGINLEDSAKC